MSSLQRKAPGLAVQLTLGFLIMLCAGLVFSWSIFVQPIETELGFLRSQTSLVFPLSLSISILGQMLAAVIIRKTSPAVNFLLAALLSGVGFFVASGIQTLGMLYLAYGALVGLSIGMLYNGVLSTIVVQFSSRHSLVTGVLLVGFGLGGMLLGGLCTMLMSRYGWRQTFLVLMGLFVLLALLGALFIRMDKTPVLVKGEKSKETGPRQMLSSKSYYAVYLWCTLLTSSCLVISGHAALCAADIGATDYQGAIANGVTSVFNVLARLVVGGVYAKAGQRTMKLWLTVIGLVSPVACLVAYGLGLLPLLLTAYALLGFLCGGLTIVINAYLIEEFGKENFGINTAITNTHLAVASMLGPAVAGFIKTYTGSYQFAFIIMLCMGVGAAALFWLGSLIQKKQSAH